MELLVNIVGAGVALTCVVGLVAYCVFKQWCKENDLEP
jgi:hypothetical protein